MERKPSDVYCFGEKMILHILLAFCVIALSGGMTYMDARMSSIFNHRGSELALDGDVNTCATSAMEDGPWWLVDFGSSKEVNKVTMQGSSCPLEIRVGDHYDNKGNGSAELLSNPVCAFHPEGLVNGAGQTEVECDLPLSGRYLTIHVVDPLCPFHMRHFALCEVETADT